MIILLFYKIGVKIPSPFPKILDFKPLQTKVQVLGGRLLAWIDEVADATARKRCDTFIPGI